MSDTVAPTGVAAPATETKPKQTRSPLNQAHARKLTKAEAVGFAAQNTAYAPALAKREIDDAFTTQFLGDVEDTRAKAAETLTNRTAHRGATAAEKVAAKSLEAAMREVQKAAKQKYSSTNRIALRNYLVGQKLNGSRSNLGQTSQALVTQLSKDTLPGFTTAKVKNLSTLRDAWVAAQETQTQAETAALDAHAELREQLESVEQRRRAVQLAADAEWPHTDDANAGVRKEFALHPHRPASVN